MRVDALTASCGLLTVAAGAFAVWQWTAPAPQRAVAQAEASIGAAPAPDRLASVLSTLAAPATATPAAEPTRPALALRLIGVMTTDDGLMAVIDADGRTLVLRPGEARAGLRLIALDDSLAVVDTGAGEQRLSLGSP